MLNLSTRSLFDKTDTFYLQAFFLPDSSHLDSKRGYIQKYLCLIHPEKINKNNKNNNLKPHEKSVQRQETIDTSPQWQLDG
jgi:hypothetical protein